MKNETLPLFGDIPMPTVGSAENPIERRQKAMKRAFANSDERWRAAYRQFILDYAETHAEFISEDCQLAYKANKKLPQTREWRASGAIVKGLISENKIKRIGFGWSKVRAAWVPKFTKV